MTDQTAVDAKAVDPTTLTRVNRLRATLLAGTVLAAAAIGLADAAPASAHDELLASSPEDGQVLDAAPASVELEFSNDIIEMGTAIIVVDAAGEELAAGEPAIAGRTVTATLPADVADGEYQVRWRAVSADGHPIEGTIDFGVGAGATGEYPAEPTSDEASEHADDAEQADSQDAEETSAASDAWPIVAGVAVGLGVIALVAALIVRTVRRRGDAS
ncbi:copper resistance CopC family protein [Agromyces bauzanensis]